MLALSEDGGTGNTPETVQLVLCMFNVTSQRNELSREFNVCYVLGYLANLLPSPNLPIFQVKKPPQADAKTFMQIQ